jgi:hypothetical protein
MIRTFATLALLGLTACAPRPDAIAPVAFGDAYAGMSCTMARSTLQQRQAELATLSAAQSDAATGDALGVFLIGVPVSSLTGGDRAGQIATVKGQVLALEERVAGCV